MIDHFRPLHQADRDGVRFSSGATRGRIAIFAVHGISPQQRYAFQDQVATSLQSYLNAIDAIRRYPDDPDRAASADRPWKTVVHWPVVKPGDGAEALQPSALRVFRGDDPDAPDAPAVDVYEGYWSPLSKGKTNIASAMQWLLKSTFLPTSSTAALPSSIGKLVWDISYVKTLLSLVLLAFAASVYIAITAWKGFAFIAAPGGNAPNLLDLVSEPLAALAKLPSFTYVVLGLALLFGYFLCQLFVALRTGKERDRRTAELKRDVERQADQSGFTQRSLRATAFHRWVIATLCLLVLVTGGIEYAVARAQMSAHPQYTWAYIGYATLIVGAVVAFQFARYLADAVVANVLGDIQIYTTHDTNSTFYDIRQQIIATVTDGLLGLLRVIDGRHAAADQAQQQPYYRAVHVFGHSLGSTVGMDALITLAKMIQEKSLAEPQWHRVRSFTTFGTALEKTKFFFDVRQPTVSAAQDQWENDVYGALFTREASALTSAENDGGIFWTNLWYFRDIVANAIASYRSDVTAGSKSFAWSRGARPHDICANYQLVHHRSPLAWVHSDYLSDPLFWEIVAPIVLDLKPPQADSQPGKWAAT